MRKSWKIMIVFFICCTVFSGCGGARATGPNLVSRVDVSYRNHSVHLMRTYTAPDKMDAVLYYLYRLSPNTHKKPGAEQLPFQCCRITVTLTDGNIHSYRLWSGAYLSVDYRPWQKIDPEQASRLFPILARMCSDTD